MKKRKGLLILLLTMVVIVFALPAYSATSVPGLTIKWYAAGKSTIYDIKVKITNKTGKVVKVSPYADVNDYSGLSYMRIGTSKFYLDGTSKYVMEATKNTKIPNKKTKTVRFYDTDSDYDEYSVFKLLGYSYIKLNLKVGNKKYTYNYYPRSKRTEVRKGWSF